MKITLDVYGGNYRKPTKKLIDRNIEAVQRLIDGKPMRGD